MGDRYRGSAGGQAPLQLQLNVPSGHLGRVMEVTADGESAAGSASAPVLTRPSVPGVSSAPQVPEVVHARGPAGFSYYISYTTAPSLPGVVSGSFNLPRHFRRVFPDFGEFWVLPSSAVLLYAAAGNGHSWAGSLTWEEL